MQAIPLTDDINVSATHYDYSLAYSPIELDGGRFLTLWSRYEWGDVPGTYYGIMDEVYGRLYEADGTPVGPEFKVNEGSVSSQSLASATPLDDGGFLVAFETFSYNDAFLSRYGITTRRFDADGVAQTGDVLLAYNASAGSEGPILTRLDDGNVLLTYLEDLPYPAPYTLKGMLLDATGTPVGTGFDIDTAGSPAYANHTVSVLDSGNVMIAYTGLDADEKGVFVRIYTEAGVAVTGPIQVNTETIGRQETPVAVTLTDGSVMVVWKSAPSEDKYDLYGRRMAADGTPLSDPVVLTANTASDQNRPNVIALADGGFMIAFQSGYIGYDVMLRRFDANGTPIEEEAFISSDPEMTDTSTPRLIELADGRIAAVWLEMVTSSSSQVMMRFFEAQTFGTADADNLRGTVGDNWLSGLAGEDLIRGLDGDDMIRGEAGNDTLAGNDGDDLMRGGLDDDLMFGGSGHDDMDGEDGEDELDGGLGNDLMRGGSGNDRLYGRSGADTMAGNDGDDLMRGGFDADRMFGGSGQDDMDGEDGDDYLDGGSGNDTIRGGAGEDDLRGGSGDDVMAGNDGNDIMRGGTDNDRMFGGTGADTLAGNDGDDLLNGGTEDDVLIGGLGSDTLVGGSGADVFVFTNAAHSPWDARDTISDFTPGEDLIDISAIHPSLAWTPDGFTGVAGQVWYSDTTSTLWVDMTGSGNANFGIDFDGTPVLDVGDLIL